MKFNDKQVGVGKNVSLGKNVKLGDYTTIYDNVVIEDNVIICDNCVIGEPLTEYYSDDSYRNPKTIIGKDSLIRSYSIIYAGSSFGYKFNTGHRVTIREYSEFGEGCSVGSYSDVQGHCKIGDYCRFHSYVNIGQKSNIGNFVFIYPFVVLTNDPTPPSENLIGSMIDDYTQIAASSLIFPGTTIGKHCLISANSSVGGNYQDDSFISGSPAKRIGKLSKMPFFNHQKKRHYPWPKNFDRGMPWEKSGYDNWIKKSND